MKRIAYEVRKGRDGYAIFALTVVNNTVVSEVKLQEYDMLIVTVHKLAHHIQITSPDLPIEKPSNPEVKGEAPSVINAEKEVGNKK